MDTTMDTTREEMLVAEAHKLFCRLDESTDRELRVSGKALDRVWRRRYALKAKKSYIIKAKLFYLIATIVVMVDATLKLSNQAHETWDKIHRKSFTAMARCNRASEQYGYNADKTQYLSQLYYRLKNLEDKAWARKVRRANLHCTVWGIAYYLPTTY